MTLCAICTVHKETMSAGFLVEPQNQGRHVSQFGPQNRQLWFGDLTNKITVTVFWFGPQNQVGYGLSVAPQNRREDEEGVGHTSRSRGLLHLEASRASVSQSSLKTGGGVTQVVHVTSSRRSRGYEVEDEWVNVMGCIELFYPNFTVFIVLGHNYSLVIYFPINMTPRVGGEDKAFSHPSRTP
jgi:hypothetical protein